MGRTGRGRTAGTAIALATALMVPVVAPAMADGGPGGPVLEPEIVLAEGRSALDAGVDLVDVSAEAILYRVERGGLHVAFGPGYSESRAVEIPVDFYNPQLAGSWLVSARMTYPGDEVLLEPVAGGAQATHAVPAGSEYAAANAAGWVEVSETTSAIGVVQVTIAADGTISRSVVGPAYTAAAGDTVKWVNASSKHSASGETVAIGLTFTVSSPGLPDTQQGRVLRYSTASGAPVLDPLAQPGVGDPWWHFPAVTDSAILVKRSWWDAPGGPVTELWRHDDSGERSWQVGSDMFATLVGDRTFLDDATLTTGLSEVTPEGAIVPVTDAWRTLPSGGFRTTASEAVYADGSRLVRSDLARTSEMVLMTAGLMPLEVGAVDLAAGTAVWTDDSVADRGSGTGWQRSLTSGVKSLLIERATSGSIKRLNGTTFGYQVDADAPQQVSLVRVSSTGATSTVGDAVMRGPLNGEASTLHAPGFFPDRDPSDALIDVATGSATPSVRLTTISDTWHVSSTFGWSGRPATITATPAAGGTPRTFTAPADQPMVQGLELVGSTLAWLAVGVGPAGSAAVLQRVDLSSPSSQVGTYSLTGDRLVTADRTHVAVDRTEGDVRMIDIYRFTEGDLEPVATLVDVVGQVAIDGGRVLWVEAGPDGDRLVAARIPGAALFTDVPVGAPFVADIEWLAEAGIGTGYSDGSFRPTAAVSRQAMAAFLYRYSGATFEAPDTASFTDVPTGSAFFREIEWMVAEGLATVVAEGTFRPTAAVSRQAMAAYLYRASGEPEYTPPTTPSFPDVPADAAFYKEIEWLAESGVTSGYGDGTFRPAAAVSRQAMAAFLHRFDALGK